MPIIRQLTEAEADLAIKDQMVLQVAEATNQLAQTIKSTSERFWSLPEDRLLAVLNNDIASSVETLEAQAALAEAVNTSLDLIGLVALSTRAPVTGRADIVLDGGVFVIAPSDIALDESAAELDPSV
jgi:hypothetical protein